MDNTINPEILQFVTSVGVSGVLIMWLWDIRAQLKSERENHDRTRQKLEDSLKDCNRQLSNLEHDTRRIPAIPESEKIAHRQRLNMGDE